MDSLAQGNASIVQHGLDDAVGSLFSAADVPLARAEELRRIVTSPAVKAVLETRIEQVVKHGHTADGDLALPLGWLLNEARVTAQMALDCLHPDKRNLVVARRRAAKAAAFLLAWIDRLDAEGEAQ